MKRVIFASILFLLSCGVEEQSYLHIVGGQNAPHKPWYGRLERGGGFVCGSSLIAKNVSLTAKHCVRNGNANRLAVRLGAWDFARSGNGGKPFEVINVRQVVLHPSQDLAILKLERRSRFKPIKYSESDIPNGVAVRAFGFGQTSFRGGAPKRLQGIVFEHIKGGNGRNNPNMIYVGKGIGKDVCFGDSGGPLVYQGKLVGAASWTGSECGTYDSRKRPSGYARIDTKWIRRNL